MLNFCEHHKKHQQKNGAFTSLKSLRIPLHLCCGEKKLLASTGSTVCASSGMLLDPFGHYNKITTYLYHVLIRKVSKRCGLDPASNLKIVVVIILIILIVLIIAVVIIKKCPNK